MISCADTLDYKYCPDCGSIHLARAWLCRDRLCPVCSWRLSLKRAAEMQRVITWIQQRYDIVAEMLTLTLRNVSITNLDTTINRMMRAWSNVTKRAAYRQSILGYARSLEITRSYDGRYHPHIHVLLLRRPYIQLRHNDWVDMWRDVCRLDYAPIVHVQTAYSVTPSGDRDYTDIAQAAVESLKYAVKSKVLADMPRADLPTMATAVKGKRLVTYGGIIKTARTALAYSDDEYADLVDAISVECPDCGATSAVLLAYRWSIDTATYIYDGDIDAAPKSILMATS